MESAVCFHKTATVGECTQLEVEEKDNELSDLQIFHILNRGAHISLYTIILDACPLWSITMAQKNGCPKCLEQ